MANRVDSSLPANLERDIFDVKLSSNCGSEVNKTCQTIPSDCSIEGQISPKKDFFSFQNATLFCNNLSPHYNLNLHVSLLSSPPNIAERKKKEDFSSNPDSLPSSSPSSPKKRLKASAEVLASQIFTRKLHMSTTLPLCESQQQKTSKESINNTTEEKEGEFAFIESLIFQNESFSVREFCPPNKGCLLKIQGRGFDHLNSNSKVASLSIAPQSFRDENLRDDIYQIMEGEETKVYVVSSDTLMRYLPMKDGKMLKYLCLNSPPLSSEKEKNTSHCFFLLDHFCLPTHFELRRVSPKRKVWSLFVFSEDMDILLDMEDLNVIPLASFPTKSLQKFFNDVSNLHNPHFQGPFSFHCNYKVHGDHSNLPPNHSRVLLQKKEEKEECGLTQVYVPPLSPANYIVWLTFFREFSPLQTISKQFTVRNIFD